MTELRQQPADPVECGGALRHEALADPMQREDALLLDRLDRDEAHGRSRHRLADRFGVVAIILATLAIGRHELRRHQPYGVPERAEPARPLMGPGTGLQANQAPRPLRHQRRQLVATHRTSQHFATTGIHAVHGEHVLCQVDSDGSNVVHDFPFS